MKKQQMTPGDMARPHGFGGYELPKEYLINYAPGAQTDPALRPEGPMVAAERDLVNAPDMQPMAYENSYRDGRSRPGANLPAVAFQPPRPGVLHMMQTDAPSAAKAPLLDQRNMDAAAQQYPTHINQSGNPQAEILQAGHKGVLQDPTTGEPIGVPLSRGNEIDGLMEWGPPAKGAPPPASRHWQRLMANEQPQMAELGPYAPFQTPTEQPKRGRA